MSRRERGRFSTHTATETLQRQLTAPAHKWRKAWVAPSGLQPESSYKVCKWVRVNEKDMDDETNGNEGEDEDDEGDHDDEEENDEEKEDGEEGEGGGEGKPTTTSTPAVVDTVPATPAPEAEKTETPAVPPEAPLLREDASVAPIAAETTSTTISEPIQSAANAVLTHEPVDPVPQVGETGASPVVTQENTAIPSNAIEMTNTAPGHTEDGNGDLGASASIELTKPDPSPIPAETPIEAAPVEVGSLGQNEDKMDLDVPDVDNKEAPEEDAGLVMGEMKPPAGQEELGVTDQDQAKEVEDAAQATVPSTGIAEQAMDVTQE